MIFLEYNPILYTRISQKNKKTIECFCATLMLNHGFTPYENEWWHFTLKKEPFPNTYFTFPISKN